MDNFKIFEANQFLKGLEQDFSGQQERIKRKLEAYVYPQLKQNPYFGKNIKKLTNYKPETWRYRIGAYRFFYGMGKYKALSQPLKLHKEVLNLPTKLADEVSCEIDGLEKIVFMIAADSRQGAY